jgi:hypothetical protein
MNRLILPRRALLKAGAAALTTSPVIIGKAAAQLSGGLMFPGPGTQHSAGGGSPVYSFLAGPAWIDSPGATASFLSQPLGTVGANNYTIVGIMMTNGGPITCTIGGVTATVYNPGSGGGAIAWALTPSSTGTIAVSAASINSVGIQVAQITNVTQLGTPTDTTAFGAQTGTWNVGSGILIPANGIAFVSALLGTSAGTAITVSGMTKDATLPVVDSGTANENFSAHTTTTGTVTPTITFTGNATAVIAVFGP